jgi:transposase InsO family protein
VPCPPDRVGRQFRAPRPNVLWVSGFTYVATWQGFVYVGFVVDWVDWFNNHRLFGPIGDIPPAEAEARYFAPADEYAMAA